MDLTLSFALKIAHQLLVAGVNVWKAWSDPGLNDKEIEALASLCELGATATEARSSPAAGRNHPRYLGLIIHSFGRAVGRHWAFNKTKLRDKELTIRLKYALDTGDSSYVLGDRSPGPSELDGVRSIAESPIASTWYQRLWKAFSDPRLTGPNEDPPLLLTDTTRAEFERHFLLAYWEGLASPEQAGLATYLSTLGAYQATVMRDLLIKDIASWGSRHIFGNTERSSSPDPGALPHLSLDDLYVEPFVRQSDDSSPCSALEVILHVLTDSRSRLIAIEAHMGNGKSLTARRLARDLAHEYLSSIRPSTEAYRPIFVNCSTDLSGEHFDLAQTIRRAFKRQADTLGIALPTSDEAFAPPHREERTVVFLDGLDEILSSRERLESVFQSLRDVATDRHRFLLFSRPSALPQNSTVEAPVISLLPFTTGARDGGGPSQVEMWLSRWNTATDRAIPLHESDLESRGLLDLATTPLLLFMIAHGWDLQSKDGAQSRATLYEGFFGHIARGKHVLARETNPAVSRASRDLLERLKSRHELSDTSDEPAAMLWLMSRTAWLSRELEVAEPPTVLRRHHLSEFLRRELGFVDKEITTIIEAGLLLTMRTDLGGSDDRILFGHRSFDDFLIGRYWSIQLKRLVTTPAGLGRSQDIESRLMNGRLLKAGEKMSVDFLIDITTVTPPSSSTIFSWSDTHRRLLFDWAQRTFQDESQSFSTDSARRHRDDRRPFLREAALAIGSLLKEGRRIEATDPRMLRSLMASGWLRGEPSVLIAPMARLAGSVLSHAMILGANFQGADLSDATFARTQVLWTDLTRADLRKARLFGALFYYCSLEHADLRGAQFEPADLSDDIHASFGRAVLNNVIVKGALYDSNTIWPAGFDPVREGAILERPSQKLANDFGL